MFSWINKPTNNKQNQWDIIFNQILKTLKNKLNDELGQEIAQENINNLKMQITNTNRLQQNLIDIKSKYHDIVTKITTLQENAKLTANIITQFIKNIGNDLQSDQLEAPLKDIHKGICEISSDKLDKLFKYLFKIYHVSLEEFVNKNAQLKSNSINDELKLVKSMNINIEQQYIKLKDNKINLQKKNQQMKNKITQLTQKYATLQLNTNYLTQQSQSNQKIKIKEIQLNQQIKHLEKQKQILEKKLKEAQNKITKSLTVIQQTKLKDQQLMEQLRNQIKRKQLIYQNSIKKFQQDKKILQQQLHVLKQQTQTYKNTIQQLNKTIKENLQKTSNVGQLLQLKKKVNQIQQINKQLQNNKENQVNKQIMRSLFLKFDNQNNQWQIKKDIRKQIYGLLKIQTKNQQKQEKSKGWFGIF